MNKLSFPEPGSVVCQPPWRSRVWSGRSSFLSPAQGSFDAFTKCEFLTGVQEKVLLLSLLSQKATEKKRSVSSAFVSCTLEHSHFHLLALHGFLFPCTISTGVELLTQGSTLSTKRGNQYTLFKTRPNEMTMNGVCTGKAISFPGIWLFDCLTITQFMGG